MCVIEGCEGKAVAKGLCAKHYMRQRRTGYPSGIGKAGRKRSWQRLLIEEEGLDTAWSSRTCTRYVQAVGMLCEAGCDTEDLDRAIDRAQRPNGTLNVSRLLEIAFKHYATSLCKAPF